MGFQFDFKRVDQLEKDVSALKRTIQNQLERDIAVLKAAVQNASARPVPVIFDNTADLASTTDLILVLVDMKTEHLPLAPIELYHGKPTPWDLENSVYTALTADNQPLSPGCVRDYDFIVIDLRLITKQAASDIVGQLNQAGRYVIFEKDGTFRTIKQKPTTLQVLNSENNHG